MRFCMIRELYDTYNSMCITTRHVRGRNDWYELALIALIFGLAALS